MHICMPCFHTPSYIMNLSFITQVHVTMYCILNFAIHNVTILILLCSHIVTHTCIHSYILCFLLLRCMGMVCCIAEAAEQAQVTRYKVVKCSNNEILIIRQSIYKASIPHRINLRYKMFKNLAKCHYSRVIFAWWLNL